MKTNLATFDRSIEAEALKLFLNNEGVQADVQDESRLQRFWFFVLPRAAVHVLVPSNQFQRAKQLFEEKAGSLLEKKAVHCPSCHSCRVHYPAMTRKNLLPTIVAHVLFFAGLMPHEYYCEDCHFTWRPSASP